MKISLLMSDKSGNSNNNNVWISFYYKFLSSFKVFIIFFFDKNPYINGLKKKLIDKCFTFISKRLLFPIRNGVLIINL